MLRWWLSPMVAVVSVGACSSGQPPLAASHSRQVAADAGPGGPPLLPVRKPASANYLAEGITISAAPPHLVRLAPDARSPAAVLTAFKAQGNASLAGSALLRERPSILLRTITDLHPVAPGMRPDVPYPGWVVIYRHVRLVSYGPRPFPEHAQDTFVAILNATTGQWTEFVNRGSSPAGELPGLR